MNKLKTKLKIRINLFFTLSPHHPDFFLIISKSAKTMLWQIYFMLYEQKEKKIKSSRRCLHQFKINKALSYLRTFSSNIVLLHDMLYQEKWHHFSFF
ncbi:hypothetical protein BIV59_05725 [Bacillus sp. MUM 13]|nr:hypothetical protein BIV59_05725 [Bacillus sp. MUM 13]